MTLALTIIMAVLATVYVIGFLSSQAAADARILNAMRNHQRYNTLYSAKSTARYIEARRHEKSQAHLWPILPHRRKQAALIKAFEFTDAYRRQHIREDFKAAERAYEREFGRQLRGEV